MPKPQSLTNIFVQFVSCRIRPTSCSAAKAAIQERTSDRHDRLQHEFQLQSSLQCSKVSFGEESSNARSHSGLKALRQSITRLRVLTTAMILLDVYYVPLQLDYACNQNFPLLWNWTHLRRVDHETNHLYPKTSTRSFSKFNDLMNWPTARPKRLYAWLLASCSCNHW